MKADEVMGVVEAVPALSDELATELDRLRPTLAGLRRSELLYRTIARSLPGGGVWLFDEDLRCLLAEGSLAADVTAERGVLQGRPLDELFDADILEVALPRLVAAAAGKSGSYETLIRGRTLWTHYEALKDSDGSPLVMVIAFDVTERKRVEQTLENIERRYTALFNNRINAIAHLRPLTDDERRPIDYVIEKVNDAFEEITGIKRANIEGRRATEVFPGIERSEFDFITTYGKIALEGGEASFEVNFRYLDKWFSVYAYSPVSGECTVIFTDITPQKRAEVERLHIVEQARAAAAAAEHERAKLAAVFEAIEDGISVFDAAGNLVLANAAQAHHYGFAGVEDMKRNVREFAGRYELYEPSGRRLPVEEWPLWRILRGERVIDLELAASEPAAKRCWTLSFSGSAVRDGEGRPVMAVIVTHDASERKREDRARREIEQRLQLAVAIAHLGFWEWRPAAGEVFLSEQWKVQLGYADDGLDNTFETWESRLHPDDREQVVGDLMRYVARPDGDYRSEQRLRHRDGSYRWVACRAIAETGPDGGATRVLGTHFDITDLKLAEQRVREAAQHDWLTGLPNRNLVFEYASHLLAAARRNQSGGAFLFIDLDRFKPINDLYGHEVGDRVLKEVADRLRQCVRQEDLIGRMGGDEFVIVLPHPGKGHRAATVAQHVLYSIGRPFEIGTLTLSVSPSIGIAHYPQHGEDAETLVRAADVAMYHAKRAGRANYQTYSPLLEQSSGHCSEVEACLKKAVSEHAFELHYQPVIDMKSRRTVGAEALLRLRAADGSMIGPDRFVPVAESSGLMGAVGEWVMTEACRQQLEWQAAGLPPIAVGINVSPLQFRQRNFVARLQHIVDRSGLDPQCLQIEVKENAVMENVDVAVRILGDVRRLGIKVALDDFGTGYSSLTELGKLPLDQLKVDQSFVHAAPTQRASRAIMDAIITLGRTLDLAVVGEGIESEESLDYMESHHCDRAQGFFISRPLSAADFSRWHREHVPA